MASIIDAMDYLKEIRGTLQLGGAEGYNGFNQLLLDFGCKRVCLDELLARIRELFKGHKTLITGFNDFLPDKYHIILSEDEIATSFVNNVKTRFGDDHGAFKSFTQILDLYTLEKISIIEVYEKVAFLFRNHRDLLLEFKTFLPDTSLGVENPTSLPIHIGKKRKFEDNAAKQFRSSKDSSHSSLVEVGSPSNGIHGQEFAFFEKVKNDSNSDVHQVLMKYMELHNLQIITQSELQNMVDDLLENYPKLLKGFNKILECSEKIVGSEEVSKNAVTGGEDQWPTKNTEISIQELDLTKCDQITPSYRPSPVDFPVTNLAERTPLAKMVLNDQYICVSPGSGDFSCRKKRINSYEEKLFRLEDARFEMDILMEHLKLTIGSAEALIDLINRNTFGENHVLQLAHYFTDRNLWCIEKLFGDWGLEVVDLLRDAPSRVLPIIQNRLLQKVAELAKYRTYFDRCANNPHNLTSFPNECGQKDSGELQRTCQNNSEENISSRIVDCLVLENHSLSISRQVGDKNG